MPTLPMTRSCTSFRPFLAADPTPGDVVNRQWSVSRKRNTGMAAAYAAVN